MQALTDFNIYVLYLYFSRRRNISQDLDNWLFRWFQGPNAMIIWWHMNWFNTTHIISCFYYPEWYNAYKINLYYGILFLLTFALDIAPLYIHILANWNIKLSRSQLTLCTIWRILLYMHVVGVQYIYICRVCICIVWFHCRIPVSIYEPVRVIQCHCF